MLSIDHEIPKLDPLLFRTPVPIPRQFTRIRRHGRMNSMDDRDFGSFLDEFNGNGSRVDLLDCRNFYFPPRKAPKSSLAIVWGNYNKCGPGYYIERKCYPYHVLEYIISGEGSFEVTGAQWQLLPGMVFGFTPDTAHVYQADRHNPMEKLCVVFTGKPTHPSLCRCIEESNKAFFVTETFQIYSLFMYILNEGLRKTPCSYEIINSLLNALLMKVSECMVSTARLSYAYVSFLKCKEYIEKNPRRDMTLQSVSQACNLDVSYIIRLFRQYLNYTPNQYLGKLIIEKSIDLLVKSRNTIKEIAYMLGFSNQYHFSTFFKKHMQISPNAFRMNPCADRRRATGHAALADQEFRQEKNHFRKEG